MELWETLKCMMWPSFTKAYNDGLIYWRLVALSPRQTPLGDSNTTQSAIPHKSQQNQFEQHRTCNYKRTLNSPKMVYKKPNNKNIHQQAATLFTRNRKEKLAAASRGFHVASKRLSAHSCSLAWLPNIVLIWLPYICNPASRIESYGYFLPFWILQHST